MSGVIAVGLGGIRGELGTGTIVELLVLAAGDVPGLKSSIMALLSSLLALSPLLVSGCARSSEPEAIAHGRQTGKEGKQEGTRDGKKMDGLNKQDYRENTHGY